MKNKKGFTLVEVMLVVTIIAILAAFIAIPRFLNSTRDAQRAACRANIANINSQWELWNVRNGSYPALAALLADTTYFPDGAPTCPIGVAYADGDGDNRIDTATHAHQ